MVALLKAGRSGWRRSDRGQRKACHFFRCPSPHYAVRLIPSAYGRLDGHAGRRRLSSGWLIEREAILRGLDIGFFLGFRWRFISINPGVF